jgi:AcrR family transcriptional regulator
MSPRLKGSKSLKSDQTHEHIYQIAMELFRAQGFDKTTMRQIADKAEVATGAAYYYFGSKEEIVLRFYRELHAGDRAFVEDAKFQQIKGLQERLKSLITHKLNQLEAHRHFLGGVFRNANDPGSPISPFSETTRDIREGNIAHIEIAIQGSDTKIDKRLQAYLPRLLWFYQMGIILFWFYDRSKDQIKTRELLDKSLKFLVIGIRLFGLPLLGPLRKIAFELLESFTSLLDKPISEEDNGGVS